MLAKNKAENNITKLTTKNKNIHPQILCTMLYFKLNTLFLKKKVITFLSI